jgi:hypothetical protein
VRLVRPETAVSRSAAAAARRAGGGRAPRKFERCVNQERLRALVVGHLRRGRQERRAMITIAKPAPKICQHCAGR